jgi:hypothetical protein
MNDAEKGFWALFNGDGDGSTKEAVDLNPNTASALGVSPSSSAMLDELEREAKGLSSPLDPETKTRPAAAPAPATEEQQPDQAAAAPVQSMPPGMPEPEGEEPADQEQTVGTEQPPEDPQQVDGYNRQDAEPPPDEEDADLAAVPEEELPSRATHGRLFADKRANPLQMLKVLEGKYGTKWAEWEPATLWWALRRDFGPVGELARNKILALKVAATTGTPWHDWDIFEKCGLAWNDIMPVIGTFQPMTPMQCAFAVEILRDVRPDEEFRTEVNAYIAAILEEDGFALAPEEYFAGAQALIDRKPWLVGLKHQVVTAWERAKDVDPTQIDWRDDNPVDIHVLKLAVVKRYLEERHNLRMTPVGGTAASTTASPPVP